MNACITLEHRFERTADGTVWTRSNHTYEESRRYLDVFDRVRLLARIRDVAVPPPAALRANGDGVSFVPLPYYIGFEEFCLRWRSVRRAAVRAIEIDEAVILKAPSTISCLVEPALRKTARPFGVEVLGDPWGIYSRGAVSHPLRPLLRSVFTWQTRSQCRHACAVRYVSNHLRVRYPAGPAAFHGSVSDVYLPSTALARAPRLPAVAPAPLRLISVGSLEHRYKGIDVLLRAIRKCADRCFDCRLVVVGEGRSRPALESLAGHLGIGHLVEFRGMLPAGDRVFAALDESDLFVMPSREEGMPRAMIEAMARALPCIGSAVGGIPELLDQEDLVSPGDPDGLAAKIIEVGKSPSRLARMSQRCLSRARDFEEQRLSSRRREFFLSVRKATESWRRATLRMAPAFGRGGL